MSSLFRKFLLLPVILLAACQPNPPAAQATAPTYQVPPNSPMIETPAAKPLPADVKVVEKVAERVAVPATPSTPRSAPVMANRTIAGIRFEGVAFDSRSHSLRVVDQSGGPGSRYSSSRDVAQGNNALLAINAGFFTPEGKPLGLVISSGKTSGGWNNASSLGSGIYRQNSGGTASISRRGSRSAVSSSRELLQAGPLLVENGSGVSGLNSSKTAVRSIILTDGGTRFWVGKTSSCSLAALGKALDSSSPAPWGVRQALNLDGGRSTDLFVSGKVKGGPFNYRSFLNRPVRNFLILSAR